HFESCILAGSRKKIAVNRKLSNLLQESLILALYLLKVSSIIRGLFKSMSSFLLKLSHPLCNLARAGFVSLR
ncbi:hypothetical protein, partial [Porphyromonas loveana]|uniref:hypothetical protein n=1 Tax=Porphyromonas loveana TaxID=1884669 RepID=UPI0035A16247